jgi:glycerol 3-phosphatase-1
MGSTPEYSLPPQELTFDGFLFDMDGTIIGSTEAVVKHWQTIGNEIGVAPEVILETSHGRRSIDILKILAPEKANWECKNTQQERIANKARGHVKTCSQKRYITHGQPSSWQG